MQQLTHEDSSSDASPRDSRPAKPAHSKRKESPPISPQINNAFDTLPHHSKIFFFGVVLPILAVIFETSFHYCAKHFFDPFPSPNHVVLFLLIPLNNYMTLLACRRNMSAHYSFMSLASGMAMGMGAMYSLMFLPLLGASLFFVGAFGFGLLGLAPALSLPCTWIAGKKVCKLSSAKKTYFNPHQVEHIGHLIILVMVLAVELPSTLTRVYLGVAANPATATEGIKWLRKYGNEEVMIRACYERSGRATDIIGSVYEAGHPLPTVEARQIFYKVTGKPFNSVAIPASARATIQHALAYDPGNLNAKVEDEFDLDTDIAGESVSGVARGLSIKESKIQGRLDGDALSANLSWSVTLNNVSKYDREARAKILLPNGAVVTHAVLTVDGVDHEAKVTVREAARRIYQAAVMQHKNDPLLVSMCGADQVLVQCYPVHPNHELKVRLEIVAPQSMDKNGNAALVLPVLTEKNFQEAANTLISLESPRRLWVGEETPNSPNAAHNSEPSKLHSVIQTSQLNSFAAIIHGERNRECKSVFCSDTFMTPPLVTEHKIAEQKLPTPKALTIIVDGSIGMKGRMEEIVKGLAQLPPTLKASIMLVADQTKELCKTTKVDSPEFKNALLALSAYSPAGGQDNSRILQSTLQAAKANDDAVLWFHAAQPLSESFIDQSFQTLLGPIYKANPLPKQGTVLLPPIASNKSEMDVQAVPTPNLSAPIVRTASPAYPSPEAYSNSNPPPRPSAKVPPMALTIEGYHARMARQVGLNWHSFKLNHALTGNGHELMVEFSINSNGSLRSQRIEKSSGSKALDQAALACLRGTFFEAIPYNISRDALKFQLDFSKLNESPLLIPAVQPAPASRLLSQPMMRASVTASPTTQVNSTQSQTDESTAQVNQPLSRTDKLTAQENLPLSQTGNSTAQVSSPLSQEIHNLAQSRFAARRAELTERARKRAEAIPEAQSLPQSPAKAEPMPMLEKSNLVARRTSSAAGGMDEAASIWKEQPEVTNQATPLLYDFPISAGPVEMLNNINASPRYFRVEKVGAISEDLNKLSHSWTNTASLTKTDTIEFIEHSNDMIDLSGQQKTDASLSQLCAYHSILSAVAEPGSANAMLPNVLAQKYHLITPVSSAVVTDDEAKLQPYPAPSVSNPLDEFFSSRTIDNAFSNISQGVSSSLGTLPDAFAALVFSPVTMLQQSISQSFNSINMQLNRLNSVSEADMNKVTPQYNSTMNSGAYNSSLKTKSSGYQTMNVPLSGGTMAKEAELGATDEVVIQGVNTAGTVSGELRPAASPKPLAMPQSAVEEPRDRLDYNRGVNGPQMGRHAAVASIAQAATAPSAVALSAVSPAGPVPQGGSRPITLTEVEAIDSGSATISNSEGDFKSANKDLAEKKIANTIGYGNENPLDPSAGRQITLQKAIRTMSAHHAIERRQMMSNSLSNGANLELSPSIEPSALAYKQTNSGNSFAWILLLDTLVGLYFISSLFGKLAKKRKVGASKPGN